MTEPETVPRAHPARAARRVPLVATAGRVMGLGLLGVLISAAAACQDDGTRPVATIQAGDTADQILYGVTTMLAPDGIRRNRLQADTAFIYEAAGLYDLRGIELLFYDENGVHTGFLQIRLFLGEHYRHAVGVLRQDMHPPRAPRPYLRRYVVKYRDAAAVRLLGKPEIEAGIVDRDHQVGRRFREQAADAPTQRQEEGQPGEHLNDAHDDQPLEFDQGLHPGLGHTGPRQSQELGVGVERA